MSYISNPLARSNPLQPASPDLLQLVCRIIEFMLYLYQLYKVSIHWIRAPSYHNNACSLFCEPRRFSAPKLTAVAIQKRFQEVWVAVTPKTRA